VEQDKLYRLGPEPAYIRDIVESFPWGGVASEADFETLRDLMVGLRYRCGAGTTSCTIRVWF
jgi:hypothetical protein